MSGKNCVAMQVGTTRIKVDGTVLPYGYCNIKLGNIKDNTFGDIWNSRKYLDFRRKIANMEKLKKMSDFCHCQFCCYTINNLKIRLVCKLP